MQFISTRGASDPVSLFDAILAGIAPDGGLYLPEYYPILPDHLFSSEQTYLQRTIEIFALFSDDADETDLLAEAAFEGLQQFTHPAIAPLYQLDHRFWLLELFHGPTRAFKDFAMQFAARLMDKILETRDQQLLLLTATSGDTGAAAVHAFAGAKRIQLCVLHPHERVSPVQRQQMTRLHADNILNLAIYGDFDDCQASLKKLLGDHDLRARTPASSVNSINFARLLGQIPYYLSTIASLTAGKEKVNFVVPTGNLGDAFAGWMARSMGAPIGQIVAAVNQNDSLYQLFSTGKYERLMAQQSMSVSMDVQAPSNFERIYFEVMGRDSTAIHEVFTQFENAGTAEIPTDHIEKLKAEMTTQRVSEAQTRMQLQDSWQKLGRILCPHTAVAVHAAEMMRRKDNGHKDWVALATAHPGKFPQSIIESIGQTPSLPVNPHAHSDGEEKFELFEHDYAVIKERLLGFSGN